ncbi:MAG: ribonuclease HII [Kosmotoga sp.]|nr:MAG: ribonuclease HII [Kosmotoga sp.]
MKMTLNEFDKPYVNTYKLIAGVDEAGRGALAGPVVAASVILKSEIEGINDSKKLSPKKRELLFEKIVRNSVFSIGIATPEEIDVYNILNATRMAIRRAVTELKHKPKYLLIDGKNLLMEEFHGECVIEGDAKSASIAAASILAKVYRDRLMMNLDMLYPEYCYASNKGYGTEKHLEAIKKYKPTIWHRLTFQPVRNCLSKKSTEEWLKIGAVSKRRLFRCGYL